MERPLSVLIIEDADSDAELLVYRLKRAGYTLNFQQVETAAEMQSALMRQPWDIVISDYSMPQFDGMSALQLLKQSALDIPFIVVSGEVGEDTAVEMMKAGASDYMRKDSMARLLPAVERELSQAYIRRERKRAEEELRAKAERHRVILETALSGFWLADINGRILEVNAAYSRMSGYAMDELPGMHIANLIMVDHEHEIDQRIQRIIWQGNDHFESRQRRKDGSIFDVEANVQYQPIDGGRIVAFLQDITERKKSEDALRKSEKNFRAFFEQAAVGVAKIETFTGSFAMINRRYCEIVGYSQQEMLRISFQTLTHPDDLQADLEQMGRLHRNEIQEFSMEKRYLHKNGSVVWVNLTVSPLWLQGENPEYHLAVVEDITERKKIAEALRESQERFQLAMDASQDGLWDWDIATNQVYYSPGYYHMLGYNNHQFPHHVKSWEDLIHPEDHEQALAVNQACIENKIERFDVEFRMRANDGSWRWILGRGKAVVRDENGIALRLIGTHTDITDRKKAEAVLREREARLKTVTENTADGILQISRDSRIIFINRPPEGFSLDDVLNTSIYQWVPEAQHSMLRNTFDAAFLQGQQGEYEAFGPGLHGQRRLFHVRVMPVILNGETASAIYTATDITHMKQAEADLQAANARLQANLEEIQILQKALQDQALHDPLTGVYNRRYLEEKLKQETDRAVRTGKPYSIVILDLDNLKWLNDTFGHVFGGDQAIKALANTLSEMCRESDTLCRYGGDEFMVLLYDTTAPIALRRVEQWLTVVQSVRMLAENREFGMTFSAGVAEFRLNEVDGESTLIRADRALYAAKANGKKQARMYTDDLNFVAN